MANKTQIKNFLENQVIKTVQELEKERSEVLNNIAVDFKEKYKKEFDEINSNLVNSISIIEKLVEDMKKKKTCDYKDRYSGCPTNCIQEGIKQLQLGNFEYYFRITEREKKQDYYDKKIHDCKAEYNRLLATTKEMNAKDSYNLLIDLGFDLSNLEVKKECTTVTTYFDASKLYIKKED